MSQTPTDTSTTPVIASGGNYDLLQMDNGFGAFLKDKGDTNNLIT
jgi:hypothetical protein